MRRRGGGSVLQPQFLSVSHDEEQSRDIDTDSDVDSKKEPDWHQKSLIAVTTEKDYEEDSGMTESCVSKA